MVALSKKQTKTKENYVMSAHKLTDLEKQQIAESIIGDAKPFGRSSLTVTMPQTVLLKPGAPKQFIVSRNPERLVQSVLEKMA